MKALLKKLFATRRASKRSVCVITGIVVGTIAVITSIGGWVNVHRLDGASP
jgi:hypothetical protein